MVTTFICCHIFEQLSSYHREILTFGYGLTNKFRYFLFQQSSEMKMALSLYLIFSDMRGFETCIRAIVVNKL